MKLTYRSVNNKFNQPEPELTKGEVAGKYSGTNRRQQYLRHIPVTQPRIDVKCCGAYYTGEPIDVEASLRQRNYNKVATSEAVPAETEAELTKSSRQQVLEELNNTHLNNIRRNLEHRLQVAKAKGDRNLISLLEAEFDQIA